ncbi:hypothetical protein BJV78DRAFT_1278762 [Lactifluus subvellereus]|nr:hypothetical protein BJV78DRAFT_1278762 [Lactifluus subvellereus]
MADSFTLNIDDSSPLLSYFPFPDTLSIPNFFAGWNPCFSLSACPTFPGQQGTGSGFHVTSQDGAAFSIQWWGNGIELSGLATGPVTYDLQLDGVKNSSISPPTSGTTLLASYDHLRATNHTLSLIVHNPTNSSSAFIAIDYALISANTTSPNVTFSNTIIEDTSLPFTGQWTFLNDTSLSSLDSTYHVSNHSGDVVNFNFSGSAISVFGFRDVSSGKFSVRLDDESVTLNGASSSKVATTLFFRTGLDNSTPHSLTITNEEDGLLAIGLINVTTAYSSLPNSGSRISHVSRGTIAAIVIAACLGALVLFITLFSLWRRRRQFGRILHRRRLFVPPNGNDHSKVLDIVRGPEINDFDDLYDDKGSGDKRRPTAGDGSGSLSFTLDLPIQSRHSLAPSRRYSGNSAQELPRSPTVSLGRTGTHARGSSRGVPLQEISTPDGVDSGETRRTPSSDAQGRTTSEDARTSGSPRDRETPEQSEGRTFELSPALSEVPLPQSSVIASTPAHVSSERSQLTYSFLDISASSRSSSVRQAAHLSSSSSISDSLRRRSDEPLSPSRRISLPFAMGYNLPASSQDIISGPSGPSFASVTFPRFSLNIRPLPRIPQAAVAPETGPSQLPLAARGTVRPHTQSSPPLHVQTQFDVPQPLPRSVSVTPAPPTSAQSGGNPVPHIVIHPSLSRPHLRASSVVSPTESVPRTVSDIHFRHSSDDERGEPESRRTSALEGEHLPSHPPLPVRPYTSPFIMHKLFGIPVSPPLSAGGQSSLQSPGAGPSEPRDRDPSPDRPSTPGSG